MEIGETTDRSLVGHLTLTGVSAEPLGDVADGERTLHRMFERALLGLCAIQIGVCAAATAQAAEYTSHREQFGKPLSTFQGVQLRAADAYIDTEAIRVTTMQAAWKHDEGLPIRADVLVAKWWAAEAGQHAVHNTQHLHGGMGADVDYPIHRYFLWGKQIEDTLGGANATLAHLGQVLAGA
jgi:alkylation response protein AidB-like acyl-CoA dehydrogenase